MCSLLQGEVYHQITLSELEARARALGYTTLRLDTSILQRATQKLYEKNGFREVGRDNDNDPEVILDEKQSRQRGMLYNARLVDNNACQSCGQGMVVKQQEDSDMRLFFWRKPAAEPASSSPKPQRWAWLGGRRFLTNTPYILPKDAEEGGRLDAQHHLFKLAAGGLYRAPLRQPRSILDVACGTGVWAREMAQQFPRTRVIGIDLDASLPERAIEILGPGGQFPQNFRFQVADALKPLPFDDASFDFVHARLISPFVPIVRWPDVVREMMRVLQPGGLIELVDHQTAPHTPSPAYNRFLAAVDALCKQRGVYAGVGEAFTDLLQQAGVQQVQQRQFVLGQGKTVSESRRQQRLLAADAAAFTEHMQPVLTRPGYFSDADYAEIIQQVKDELPEAGIVWPVVFCFGMKL